MIYNIVNTKENIEYIQIIEDLFTNSTVQQMKNFRQHYKTSCLEHCLEVSYISYKICKKFGLDYVAAARAGLLHDLFLYDWRHSRKQLKLESYHAFIHPKIALENASKLFELTDKEKDIIVKHMWPVTFFDLPKYRESFIITLVDKYSALKSFKQYYHSHLTKNVIYRYAYAFLAFLVFRI